MNGLHDISRTIGNLEATAKILSEDQKNIKRSIDEMRADMQNIYGEIEKLNTKMDEYTPTFRMVRDAKQRVIGAGMLGIIFGGGSVAALWNQVRRLFEG